MNPAMLRLFVAWPAGEAIRQQLGGIVRSLRDRMPAASWARPESIHLTFAFLGDTPETRIGTLAAALEGCASARAIEVRAEGVGFFPGARRARVAWIGIEPSEPVRALAAQVRAALAAAGARFDEKPFKPHLTLARLKDPWREPDVARLREAFSGWTPPAATLDRVVLYRSTLGSAGAAHAELHAVALRP
jgi:2'-5' RNA ligase